MDDGTLTVDQLRIVGQITSSTRGCCAPRRASYRSRGSDERHEYRRSGIVPVGIALPQVRAHDHGEYERQCRGEPDDRQRG